MNTSLEALIKEFEKKIGVVYRREKLSDALEGYTTIQEDIKSFILKAHALGKEEGIEEEYNILREFKELRRE